MRARGLALLAALTLALVAVAAALVWRETSTSHVERQDHALLLPSYAGKAAAIDVGDVQLRLQGEGWVLPQKSNYPADPAVVDDLLSNLAHLVPIEEKTSDPARYTELGLGEPGPAGPGPAGPGKEGGGKLVRISGTDGKELATVIVGRTAPSLGRVGGGTYVRLRGDARTWLVEGVVRLPARPLDFAQTSLFGLDDAKAIQSVTVQAGKSAFTLTRAKAEDGFAVAGGDPHPDAAKVAPLTGLSVELAFQDVRPSGSEKVQKTVTFQSFAGVKYILSVIQSDKQVWVRAGEDGPDARAYNDSHAAWAYRLPDGSAEALKLTPDALSGTHSTGAHK